MSCNTKYKILSNEIIGFGAQGSIYLTIKDNKKKYVTKNPVGKKEAEISKILSGIGPKIYDIYECKTLEETKKITNDGKKLKDKGRFIVMEKLTGLDLNDYIQEEDIFIEDDDKWVNDLIKKIRRLHKMGYHHNDLTTSNIFVVFNKVNKVKDIKIIDFGHTKKVTKKGEEDDYKTLLGSLNTFGSHILDKIQPLVYAVEEELEKYKKPKKKASPQIKKISIKKPSIKLKKKIVIKKVRPKKIKPRKVIKVKRRKL